ncbi:hypothetical protein SLS62_003142 [Diatrype stigma]|uniref:Major facilitator superfamily (MFS) profile domain-containing protein n=1 Tax=Diatrype stigma TaxID=117547 RepID=A0AAN9UVA4_9PEZI
MRLPSWNFNRQESVHDYAGVLVPLDEAHLHSHSARVGKTEFEEAPDEDADEAYDGLEADAVKDQENESTGMLQMSAAEYTIDGLRREVRKGGGRAGHSDLWMQGVSLTLPSLSQEFDVSEKTVRYTTSSLFAGLCVGSFFWGLGADIIGRRVAFNFTLLITSVFGIWAAYAPSWGSVCFLFACLGTGVGGNLPVDGAVFLEFLPDASSSLLTLLSVWWPVGQLVSSFFAWYFITNWPIDEGWRHFVKTIGLVTLVMFLVRFFVFHLFESPKFLLTQGRQAEAVAVVHGMAYRNGKKTWLTEEILDAVADGEGGSAAQARAQARPLRAVSTTAIIKENLTSMSLDHIRPLFQNRTLGITTLLIWFCWATIGMGYPLFNAFLPQYLSHGSGSSSSAEAAAAEGGGATTPEAYRNYAIMSVVGVPGSLLAAYAVDHKSRFLGRRGTLACSTLVSAAFLFLFAAVGGASPAAQLLFTCVESFCQNIMYGVLYAFTPEVFPAPVRGVGTGAASFLNRVAGLVAPVLAANVPGDGATVPIYMSAALILAAFGGMVLIPIETRGRQRL